MPDEPPALLDAFARGWVAGRFPGLSAEERRARAEWLIVNLLLRALDRARRSPA